MVHLDYRDARPIYMQIVDDIKNQIHAGVLVEGDKLPSVRELAAELAINPNTIQRAYRELEVLGLIASVSGKGSFICGICRPVEQETEKLWVAFDEAAENLQKSGVSLQMLLQHLNEGGDHHA